MPTFAATATDEMRVVKERVAMDGGANRPTLRGADVNVVDYTDDLVTGFTALYHLLLQERDALLDSKGPLLAFAKDEVRVILRPTRVYALMLQESFHPDVLRNALDRDRLFDRL